MLSSWGASARSALAADRLCSRGANALNGWDVISSAEWATTNNRNYEHDTDAGGSSFVTPAQLPSVLCISRMYPWHPLKALDEGLTSAISTGFPYFVLEGTEPVTQLHSHGHPASGAPVV